MNLRVLKKSRRAPAAGDIFAMLPPDGFYLFGRVISTDAPGPMGAGCVLIYVYSERAGTMQPVPVLYRGRLLTPPMMTNRLPWSRGYFQTIEQRPLHPMDRLPQHCFADWWRKPPQYFDEYGRRLASPVEPVGEFGLKSFRTIDDAISRALGIPLAPDDDP